MGMFNAQEATKQEALDAGLEDAEELINNPASKVGTDTSTKKYKFYFVFTSLAALPPPHSTH